MLDWIKITYLRLATSHRDIFNYLRPLEQALQLSDKQCALTRIDIGNGKMVSGSQQLHLPVAELTQLGGSHWNIALQAGVVHTGVHAAKLCFEQDVSSQVDGVSG